MTTHRPARFIDCRFAVGSSQFFPHGLGVQVFKVFDCIARQGLLDSGLVG